MSLQETFDEALQRAIDPASLVAALISQKAAEKGIVLTKRQRARLERQLREKDVDRIPVGTGRRLRRAVDSIVLTEDDLGRLEEKLRALKDGLPEIFERVADDASAILLASLRGTWPAEERGQEGELARFHKALRATWGGPVSHLRMLVTIARGVGQDVLSQLKAEDDPNLRHSTDALCRLHARSCQVASEVVALLSAGFADGALARWRTLHETAVTAQFIQQHGEEAAERFLDHAVIETQLAGLEYQRHCRELGYAPLSDEDLARAEAQAGDVTKRYGADFAKRYGWAAQFVCKRQITFADIATSVHQGRLRPFYRMASQNIHSSPKGILFALGLLDEDEVLLDGPSNLGLADPAQNTAISLTQGTCAFLLLSPSLDTIVSAKVMLTLASEVAEEFVRASDALEGVGV